MLALLTRNGVKMYFSCHLPKCQVKMIGIPKLSSLQDGVR